MSHGAALGDRVIEALGLQDRRAGGGNERAHSGRRARRHRLRGRRAAAAARRAPAASRSPRCSRTASPGEPVAAAFPHLASAYPQARFSSQARAAAAAVREHRAAALFSAAPHGVSAALIDALLGAAEHAGTAVARGRHLGGLPLPQRGRPTRRCTRTRTARRSACAQFTCALPEHLAELRHRARRPSRLLRHRDAARERAAARRRAHQPAAVRQRRHRQHRLGPQARARHAPSAAPRRSLQLQRARAPARARRSPPARAPPPGSSAEFAFVPHSGPFARGIHVTLQAQLERAAATPRRCSGRCAATTPARRSCASRARRRASRTSWPATTRTCRRGAWAARSRCCARSTTSTRAPPAAPCSG